MKICPTCHNEAPFLVQRRTVTGNLVERCDPCDDKVNAAKRNPRDFTPLVIRKPKLLEGRLVSKK